MDERVRRVGKAGVSQRDGHSCWDQSSEGDPVLVTTRGPLAPPRDTLTGLRTLDKCKQTLTRRLCNNIPDNSSNCRLMIQFIH